MTFVASSLSGASGDYLSPADFKPHSHYSQAMVVEGVSDEGSASASISLVEVSQILASSFSSASAASLTGISEGSAEESSASSSHRSRSDSASASEASSASSSGFAIQRLSAPEHSSRQWEVLLHTTKGREFVKRHYGELADRVSRFIVGSRLKIESKKKGKSKSDPFIELTRDGSYVTCSKNILFSVPILEAKQEVDLLSCLSKKTTTTALGGYTVLGKASPSMPFTTDIGVRHKNGMFMDYHDPDRTVERAFYRFAADKIFRRVAKEVNELQQEKNGKHFRLSLVRSDLTQGKTSHFLHCNLVDEERFAYRTKVPLVQMEVKLELVAKPRKMSQWPKELAKT
jgi:hypothetical protein